MSIARRLLATDEAQETRVFLLMAGFGFIVAAIYWFVAYEPAGTILLAGFGLATGLIAFRLAADPASRRLRRARRERHGQGEGALAHGGPASAASEIDMSGGGAGDVDRPFRDEQGRIPDDTFAPFAVGLGLALAGTGLVFGLAPIVVGLLPLAWGAWTWLSAASEELRATGRDERTG